MGFLDRFKGKTKETTDERSEERITSKLNTKSSDELTSESHALIQSGRNEEALEYLEVVLKRGLGDSIAFFLKGIALTNIKKYDEALDCYDKALTFKEQPALEVILQNKRSLLFNLGRYNEALECCDAAIKLEPNNAMNWGYKGAYFAKLDKCNEAIDCYNEALKIDPKNATFLCLKGQSLVGAGQYTEAKECLELAVLIDPSDPDSWRFLGLATAALGLDEEAINYFNEASRRIHSS